MSRSDEPPTSATFLRELADLRNDEAWRRFVERYQPLIERWCGRWDLPPQDREELVAVVLLKLVRALPDFRYDRQGSFRGWLQTVVHNAAKDLLRTRARTPGSRGAGNGRADDPLRDLEAPGSLDGLAHELDGQLERDRQVLQQALTEVRRRIEPHTWEAFRLRALEGRPGAEVAATLRMRVTAVQMAKMPGRPHAAGRGRPPRRAGPRFAGRSAMISCPTREKLQELQDEQLREPESLRLEAHVDSCPHCQRVLDELPTLPAEFRALWPRLPSTLNDLQDAPRTHPAPESGEVGPDSSFARTGADPPNLPGYEILGVLGRGGMGVVYQARQVRLDRLVALKVIRPHRALSTELRQRFEAEARIVARFDHPHIVRVYETGEHSGHEYLALEHVAGGTLAQALHRQGRFPPRAAAEIVASLAEAVEYAHRNGVIHRDLKPGNVLLQPEEQCPAREARAGPSVRFVPKIADFGLARQLVQEERPTVPGAVLGTPAYMAPEQARGERDEVGTWTDVYGLGAILYELLTGRPPHGGASPESAHHQARVGAVVPPRELNPRVPSALNRICCRALRTAPRDRHARAADLASDLRRYLDRPRRVVRGLSAGLAVATVLCLAAVAGWSRYRAVSSPTPAAAPDTPAEDPLQAEVRFHVRSNAGERQVAIGGRSDELVTHPGEKVRALVRLTRPAHVYLLALDVNGDVTPLYPWHRDGRRLVRTVNDPPPPLPPQTEVLWPDPDSGLALSMEDVKGRWEALLLLVKPEPRPGGKSLAEVIGPLPLAPQSLGGNREFELGSAGAGQRFEGATLEVNPGDPKELVQFDTPLEMLLRRLGKEFELVQLVRIVHHTGERPQR
jgi:RNA polymerase sigma factor (sigma-70 family)